MKKTTLLSILYLAVGSLILPTARARNTAIPADTYSEHRWPDDRTIHDEVAKRTPATQGGCTNVLIVLIDDVGFGLPDTFGGEVHTPTLTRLRDAGVSYNAFHTASICSPTRAALLTGPQPPSGRQRHDRRAGFRLRRLYRSHPQDVGDNRRDPAPLRLQIGGVRQMAQHAREPDDCDGTV